MLPKYKNALQLHQAQGYKTFFMLNSSEHDISAAHKNEYADI